MTTEAAKQPAVEPAKVPEVSKEPKKPNSMVKLRAFLTHTAQGKSYLIAMLTLGLTLAVFIAGVLPTLEASAKVYADNELKQSTVTELENKISILNSLVAEEAANPSLVSKLNESLPDGVVEEDLVITIAEIARKNNVTLRTIDFTPLEKNRKISQIYKTSPKLQAKYANIIVEGSTTNLTGLMKDIEANKRVFNVRTFNLSRREGRNVIDNDPVSGFALTVQTEVFYWDKNAQQL